MKLSGEIFEKHSNIKCYENVFWGSRVVPCGQTDRWTETTKLIVTFCNFVNGPKSVYVCVLGWRVGWKKWLIIIYKVKHDLHSYFSRNSRV